MGNGIRLGNQVINQNGAPSINENTLANRPAAGQAGRLFVDTTNNLLQRDTGSSYVTIGAVASTPNLQAVCTVGNTYAGDASFSGVRIGIGQYPANTNTLLGASSLLNTNSSTGNNVAIGYTAMQAATSAGSCTVIGSNAAVNLTTGNDNTVIGYYAGRDKLVSGISNVFLGGFAGRNQNGSYNTLIGYQCDPAASIGSPVPFYTTALGYGAGGSPSNYHSYNVFIGSQCGSSYQGNGINGLNTAIGSLLSLSTQPTVTGAIIFGNNNGVKQQMYSSFNWVLGGGADNGIHQLQLSGGLYCQTLSPSGVTWAVNTTITLGSSNFYYVYTGAGFSTITLPTALGNNNIYTFINSVNFTYTISTSGGQNIYRKNSGAIVTNFNATSYSTHQLIADGNNKFYEII